MGKTTLLFQLLEKLGKSVRSVFLCQTQCDSRELLHYLADALGIESQDHDVVWIHARLSEVLLHQAQIGRPVLLVIDEAQNLSDSVLETVRLLSDFEASDRKLLHIVLSGQPELAHRLSQPHLAQLRQRISILTRLEPLSPTETSLYVNHRLQVAGHDRPEIFSSASLALIAERSQGIPRNVNNICFNALSLGCAMGRKKIGLQEIREATADLSLDSKVQRSSEIPAGAAALQISRAFFSRTIRSLLAARSLQAGVLLAVLAGMAIYFAERNRAEPPASTGITQQNISSITPNPASSPNLEMISAPLQSDPSLDLSRSKAVQQNDNKYDPSSSFTYVIQPHDTLRGLCFRFLGSYDDSVITELWKLNQNLTDPDRIIAGQQVRFPVSPRFAGNGNPPISEARQVRKHE
jgi:type II secretory pathway predicted ATPase ExeA